MFWGRQEWAAGYRKGLRMGDATGDGRDRLNGGSIKAKELGIQRGDAYRGEHIAKKVKD